MAEEDTEVFEITDFTTASEWERFISQIEELVHEWKLADIRSKTPLRKNELALGNWDEKAEPILFADFKFFITRHWLKREEDAVHSTQETATDGETENESEVLPPALQDMMNTENDFPARAHCLCRWYGLREFITIAPAGQSDSIVSESKVKILLSSVSIAISNTGCLVPIFVQVHHRWRKYYAGGCEVPGLRTNFEMVHLKRVPKQFYHLHGLLDLFKTKLACPISPLPPVSVSVRFTYVLNDWTTFAWTQVPPDFDMSWGQVGFSDFGEMPFGATEDPVSELHLATTWPTLSEDMIVDNDVYTDLDPLQAPYWSVRVRMTDDPQCLLTEFLTDFTKVCRRSESTEQLLGRSIDDDEDAADISQALQRLTEPVPGYQIPSLSTVVSKATTKFAIKPEEAPIPADILNELLLFLFPDAREEEGKDEAANEKEVSEEVKELQRKLKAAPFDSLTHRLAICFCNVNHTMGGLRAIAHLWQEFVLEMRYRWENKYTLPGISSGVPNLGSSLLHQKLQMLNCCIEKKRNRELHPVSINVQEAGIGEEEEEEEDEEVAMETEQQTVVGKGKSKEEESREKGTIRESSAPGTRSPLSMCSSLSDDDEFYECEEESSDPSLDGSMKDTESTDQTEDSTAKKPKIDQSSESNDPVPGTSKDLSDDKNESEAKMEVEEEKSQVEESSQSSSGSFQDPTIYKPVGRLRQYEDVTLLNLDEPLYIPITQDPSPLTEDMLEEQADILAKLGTTKEGAHLRARMQSASLLSDMEAFKAANPGCVLEDFVRWYSPRDYVIEEVMTEEGKVVKKGQLSSRMQIPGNMWVDVWQTAKPIPVRRQKRLFDDTKEAEKVLHFLAALKPAEVALHLMPMLVAEAVHKLMQHDDDSISSLKKLLEQLVSRASRTTRQMVQQVKKYEDLIKLIGLAETVIARAQSLRAKFTHQEIEGGASADQFVSSLLDQPEVDVLGAAKGPAGKIIHKLFAMAQKSSHMIVDNDHDGKTQRPPSTVPDFPEPAGKEYILRTVLPRPTPYSRPSPQRMFCVLVKDECRFAGAFSSDTTFM
ncbi:rab3 GTPase-activating protein catalytic subunit-like [Lineus longissimus]|uniref:rab3 GTPase-activating protein catalytic subunit-like n=1 Tax=Lineus longissimus TaxID=88925 RepID=UPI00315DEF10